MKDWRFVVPVQCFIILETLVWIWALLVFSDKVELVVAPKKWSELFFFTMTMGYFCGLNAIAGHELLHKREWYHKALGNFAYTKFMYSHFLGEHIKGHHKNLATPEDSATARINETLYHFIYRNMSSGIINSFKRDFNKMIAFQFMHLTILTIIYKTLGLYSLVYQFIYTFWGIFYLESINYIEHYGLKRNKDENGIYESISIAHSWNAASSLTLFRIQRHSDHHTHSYRPYQILRKHDNAPYLPFDYTTAILIAQIPPFWFKIVNPRLQGINNDREA